MKKMLFEVFMMMLGLYFLISDFSVIYAQESKTYEFTLEEITVTAQKRSEDQQKVAIAMDTIYGDEIKELSKNNLDEILSTVSSVLINKANDGFRVSIRGISQDAPLFNGIQASTPTVAVNKDGVYTNRNSSGQELYDIERVEVLYGPQSTLYASTSPGGVVNIITADPKTDKYEGSGILEYGNYNLLHTQGSFNAPLNGKMALRVSFNTSVRDGYLTNGSDDEDAKSARLKTLYKPNEKLSFVITGEISRTYGQGISGVKAFGKQSETDNPWTSASATAGSPNDQEQKKISGHMDWDLGGTGVLSLTASYSKTNNSGSSTMEMGNDTIAQNNEANGYEKGAELRVVSSAEFFFKWIIGYNIYKSKDQGHGESYTNGATVASQINRQYNLQDSSALYANITYPIMEKFRITGGFRQSWDKNDYLAYQKPGKPPEPETTDVGVQKYNNPDYKIGVEYDIDANSMLFSDYSTSYRTQGMSFNAKGALPPEKLKAYTLGSKNRFFGNKLQLNASAYLYDYKNYLVTDMHVTTVFDANNNGVRDVDETTMTEDLGSKSVGEATIYGVDVQTTTIISNNDKMDVSISYMKKYFKKLYFDFYPITNSLGQPDLDFNGVEMSNAPHLTINGSYDHIFPLWNGGTFTARLDIRYQSSYKLMYVDKNINIDQTTFEYSLIDMSKIRIQEAYHISNFSAIYANPDGKFTLTGYVKNLENYAVKRSLIMDSMVIGAPRTYGAVLSVRF